MAEVKLPNLEKVVIVAAIVIIMINYSFTFAKSDHIKTCSTLIALQSERNQSNYHQLKQRTNIG